jgi:K+-sensing histidine kinase KdpD
LKVLSTNKPRNHILFRYAMAILLSLTALYMRALLTPILGDNKNPYHTAWLAVVIAAWYLGLGPSILTVVIQTLGVWYYFLPPRNSFLLQSVPEAGGLLGFVVLSGLIVALGEANRRSLTERRNAEAKLDADLHAMARLQEVGNQCVREGSDFWRVSRCDPRHGHRDHWGSKRQYSIA